MNQGESERIGQLQGDAGDLWAGLTALAALTAKIAEAESHRPNETDSVPWGDDPSAAARLARELAEDAARLASAMDFMMIKKFGREAA